ncbi:MAG: MFS transporter [Candidatus Heimdallarchaeaceae archaeon]
MDDSIIVTELDAEQAKIEAKSTDFGNILKWSSYDAADTLFSQGILSIVFQPFALLLAYESGITSYWGAFALMSFFMAFSNLLVALFGPIIGSISDTIGKRKPAVLISAALMSISTLAFMIWRNFWWLCIMFVFANFGYQAGRMFYDSMIPFIARTDQRGITSGISGSLSFIGTFAAIGLGFAAYAKWGKYSDPSSVFEGTTTVDYTSLRWLSGIIVVVIFLFAIPFLFSKEKENINGYSFAENLKQARENFKETIGEILRYKNAVLFIVGWFFVTDASNTTILYMQLVMVDGAGASPTEALLIIAMGGALSMVGAIIVGVLLDRWGPKKNFIINIFAWFVAVTVAILACIEVDGKHIVPWQIMFIVAFFIGLGFGGLWLIGRQFIFEIAPPKKVTQYQGFKQIAGRVSAIVSPLLFMGVMGIASSIGLSISNQYAFALVPLLLFFLIGLFVILKYVDVHKEYLAGERAPYKKLQE